MGNVFLKSPWIFCSKTCTNPDYSSELLKWCYLVSFSLSYITTLIHKGNCVCTCILWTKVYSCGIQAQTKAPSSNPELVEFQPGQVIFRSPLTCPPLRVQAIHPLTKSLTKTNKKWPWVSKMRELLAQRMSWNLRFFFEPAAIKIIEAQS